MASGGFGRLSTGMAKPSAGLLPYRVLGGKLEVLLVHPGGPFWAGRDEGAWSLSKGEIDEAEDPLAAARREFTEETGFVAEGEFLPLGSIRQKSGKIVAAWAVEMTADPARLRSNLFPLEWPPKSGTMKEFPEVDRAGWFPLDEARRKLLPAQLPFIERLAELAPGRRARESS